MDKILINGQASEIAMDATATVQQLVDELTRRLTSPTSMIDTIRIDGALLDEDHHAVTLDAIAEVAIFTAEPRAYAIDTVKSLSEFTLHLEQLSRGASLDVRAGNVSADFARLVDGIATFSEAVLSVKKILKLTFHPELNMIEADLLSILDDTLAYQREGQHGYMADMMLEHLPSNFAEWREKGLPMLIEMAKIPPI